MNLRIRVLKNKLMCIRKMRLFFKKEKKTKVVSCRSIFLFMNHVSRIDVQFKNNIKCIGNIKVDEFIHTVNLV